MIQESMSLKYKKQRERGALCIVAPLGEVFPLLAFLLASVNPVGRELMAPRTDRTTRIPIGANL